MCSIQTQDTHAGEWGHQLKKRKTLRALDAASRSPPPTAKKNRKARKRKEHQQDKPARHHCKRLQTKRRANKTKLHHTSTNKLSVA